MFRYVAFCWTALDRGQEATANELISRLQAQGGWHQGILGSGLAVFAHDIRDGQNRIYALPRGTGAIVGKIFSRSVFETDPAMEVSFEISQVDGLHAHGSGFLLNEYWGRYVAFWQSHEKKVTYVFRDPTGSLPCFEMTRGGVRIYFSWLSDVLPFQETPLSINWEYVRAAVTLGVVQSRATGLNEITEVLGGELVSFNGDKVTRKFCWNPALIASQAAIEDPTIAASRLRSTTQQCVEAWGSCHKRVLLRMSGGIDSSIVLSCLRASKRPPDVVGLTHYSPGAHSDERPFARIAARSASIELLECEQPKNVDLRTLLRMHVTPFPRSCLPAIQSDRLEAQYAHRAGATAIFSGAGGDEIFYQGSIALTVADYLRRHGPRPQLFSVALNAARAMRTSVWFVLSEAITKALRGHGWHPLADAGMYRALVTTDVARATAANLDFAHPFFVRPRNPIGKAFQIYTFLTPPDYYDVRSHSSDPEHVHPLWSQPLIELALAIPTYVLCTGGWDRALARRAFMSMLPREVHERRSKGLFDEQLKEIQRRHLPLLRELLLDGQLVKHGLLNRQLLESVLSGEANKVASHTVELFDHLSTEAWLQSWTPVALPIAQPAHARTGS